MLDLQNLTRLLVFDADNAEQFERLKQVAQSLRQQAVPSYLETPRRGGHLRLFFEQPVSGQKVRGLGLKIIKDNNLQVELYPKQKILGDGPGSLVRLPLGIHRLTGRRYSFITPEGKSLGSFINQAKIISHPKTVPMSFVEANQYQLLPRPNIQNAENLQPIITRSTGGESIKKESIYL